MSEYYAVQRSDEYLAHYGVKGMKWGVRKAVEKGNAKRLARHYRRAYKKLNKLNDRTNIEKQRLISKKYDMAAKGSRMTGRVALGALAGIVGADNISKIAKAGFYKKHGDAMAAREKTENWDARFKYKDSADTYERLGDKARDIGYTVGDIREKFAPGIAGAAIGSYGYSAYSRARSNMAKNRTTKEGHAKAVKDRDAWRKEMRSAFKGTRYSNLPNIPKKRRKSK